MVKLVITAAVYDDVTQSYTDLSEGKDYPNLSLEDIFGIFEDYVDFDDLESRYGTIDHGGTDDSYELNLPDCQLLSDMAEYKRLVPALLNELDLIITEKTS